jgi:hypothetical protein
MRTMRMGGRSVSGFLVGTCVAAIGLFVSAGGASAATPDASAAVPPDAQEWFSDHAARVVAEIRGSADIIDIAEKATATAAGAISVGSVHALAMWSAEYRNGVSDAVVSTPIDEWIAPMMTDGRFSGTVTAWRERGVVTLAYFDDNAELARALDATAVDIPVVYDAPLDAFFTVSDEAVAPLSRTAYAEIQKATAVVDFQRLLVVRYAGFDKDVSGLSPSDPQAAMVGGGPSVPRSVAGGPSAGGRTWVRGVGVGVMIASVFALVWSLARSRAKRRVRATGQ